MSASSARASDLRTAASAGTLPSFLSDGWVREAGDGLLARFVTRQSLDWSPLRAGLHALRNIHA